MIYVPAYREVDVFLTSYSLKIPLLLKGPTGCGKSVFVESMAQKLDKPLIQVVCNEDTHSSDLFGRYILKGTETEWIDGPVTRAVRGGAVLYLDEFAEAREDVIVSLHSLMDHRREIFIDKKSEAIKAHPDFFIIASFNPGYQKSIKELKPSTRQRFICISFDFLEPEKEKRVLLEQTGCTDQVADRLVKLATKIRESKTVELRETLSTRLLVYAARMIGSGLKPREACHHAVAETLSDDPSTVRAMKDLIDLSL